MHKVDVAIGVGQDTSTQNYETGTSEYSRLFPSVLCGHTDRPFPSSRFVQRTKLGGRLGLQSDGEGTTQVPKGSANFLASPTFTPRRPVLVSTRSVQSHLACPINGRVPIWVRRCPTTPKHGYVNILQSGVVLRTTVATLGFSQRVRCSTREFVNV